MIIINKSSTEAIMKNIQILFIFFLLLTLTFSCATKTENIKFQKEYKKEILQGNFYIPPVPDHQYILEKRYFYTDNLLAVNNFGKKRIDEDFSKINLRSLMLKYIDSTLLKISRKIEFQIIENGFETINAYSADNNSVQNPPSIDQSNSNENENNNSAEKIINIASFDGKITKPFLFIVKVDSWGLKYIDYKGTYVFFNTTSMIYDIENNKYVWKRMGKFEIEYDTGMGFNKFVPGNTLAYVNMGIKEFMEDIYLDMRR